MRKTVLLAGILAASFSGMAWSADLQVRTAPMPAIMAYNWSGFYVGLNAGYTWSQNRTRYNYALDGAADAGDIAEFNAAGLVPLSFGGARGGFAGGAQLGYNYQFGSLLFGLEGDLQYLDSKRSASQVFKFADGVDDLSIVTAARSRLDWLGTVRTRVGLTFDRALIYATGGLAIGRAKDGTSMSSIGISNGVAYTGLWNGGKTGTRVGWALGGGVEYAITQSLSLKAEYLYYDLGTTRYAIAGGSSDPAEGFLGGVAKARLNGSLARVGLNWKFGAY
ncbi:outer membrane beta-barrel protein [Methylocella sp. CPCC 101449]|uniref:outer membrane protein n=1 Tax=Methylocella sp. CPCC 101449 TaxID=2987531 RepID=UPI00288FE138|nr:outer membrane beta-barrel protein [Methylocella sp. CPCC 101449]MDT2023413.1 outer membrane beta-barrel protein [Methylocella sp. CPCC 101449]